MIWGLLLLSCKEARDTRFFAPELEFEAATYSVSSDGGGVDVAIRLSRPAPIAFQIGLNFGGSLQEGVHFTVPSHSLDVAEGAHEAAFHVSLIDEQIWDEESWIDVALSPGSRYTVNAAGNCTARIQVKKTLVLPVLELELVEGDPEMNPFLPQPLSLQISTPRAPKADLAVQLSLGDLLPGADYLLDLGSTAEVTFPEGATSVAFRLDIVQKDVSGYDKTVPVTLIPAAGKYGVSPEKGTVNLHLSDPVLSFKPIFRTAASQGGAGYVFRQAFRKADGSWDGNTTVDLGVSSEGSNYLRNFRNMFDHPSFGCQANASVSQFLRMSELFPNLLYPNKEQAILDYGNDQGHREFSPADSLLRFVLSKGETQKGTIHLARPRTFKAYVGSYDAWQDKSKGNLAWVLDSKATGGKIDASTHQALTGAVSVTLERLEGTFDFSNTSEPIFLTAWLSSDSDLFLKADTDDTHPTVADPCATWDIVRDGDYWKISYRLWPR